MPIYLCRVRKKIADKNSPLCKEDIMQNENNNNFPQTVTIAVVGDENRRKRYEELTFMDDFMFRIKK